MIPQSESVTADHIASRVRQNATSAAIAAVLMAYFGYAYLARPGGTELFDRAALVLYYTLRIGAVAMGMLALWSMSGQRLALLVDAVVSVAIGVLFALTSIAMLLDGGDGLQCVLYAAFGAMFVSAGIKNWRDYFALATL